MAETGERVRRARTGGTPHGAVPFHHIADPQVRDAVMKLNENILALERRLAAVEGKGKEQ